MPEESIENTPTVDIVINYEGRKMFFRTERTTPLVNIMTQANRRTGLPRDTMRFVFDGVRLFGSETPDKLEMDEGENYIDCLVQQTGG